MKKWPEKAVVDTLVDLVCIPSPTGYTEKVVQYLEKRLQAARDDIQLRRDYKGGLLVTLPGKEGSPQRLLTAHVDTLGGMVKEIKADGRLRLTRIGGFTWNSIEGVYCTVHTRKGREVTGTVLPTHTSVHVYDDAAKQERNQENMEIRLDVAVTDADDVSRLGIGVGDFVSFDPRVETLESGYIKGRHMDDKASAAILLELILDTASSEEYLPCVSHVYFSTYEEVGFGANATIPAGVKEFLAVDMGAIGDGQNTDEHSVSICVKDSSGPYHYHFRNRLAALAEEEGLHYKLDIYPHYGSDASAAVRAGHDLVHGLIGPGVDASHAFERTHKDALENTYRLLKRYIHSPI
ncbi:M42 family metallopeptidase [Desmospora profundinema]|uniref:Aminopeptidase FrvX n=1 Tax=Desmospora profundinema TaxID=1571184 RepID=A0ABU1IKK6_9BACL|nr:M42 family metallopeptidase [Desmospora profundinema]MDR6225315.1 putative aminopeptidase FrvX [Desmospora profundinema]